MSHHVESHFNVFESVLREVVEAELLNVMGPIPECTCDHPSSGCNLVRWIDNRRYRAKKMIEAAMYGPDAPF